MTDDLIARLKAQYDDSPHFLGCHLVEEHHFAYCQVCLGCTCAGKYLPEIIAALEERERMRAVVPVVVEFLRHFTDPDLDTADDPSSWLEHWEYGDAMRLIAYWTTEGRAALDALEKKGEPRG